MIPNSDGGGELSPAYNPLFHFAKVSQDRYDDDDSKDDDVDDSQDDDVDDSQDKYDEDRSRLPKILYN